LKKRELGITFYDLSCTVSGPNEIKQPIGKPIADVLKAITDALNRKLLKNVIEKSSSLLELAEIKYDEKEDDFQLLFNFSDSDLADFLFKNIKTRKSHPSAKEDHDGIDRSTHALIKAQSHSNALMIMTARTGVSSERIARFLNMYVKTLGKNPAYASLFTQPHPNGAAGKTYRVRYRFTCAAHQDATLKEALNGGKLHGVKLIKYEKDTPFDNTGTLRKKATILQLEPESPTVTLGKLQVSLKEAPDGYSNAVVSFTDGKGMRRENTFDISDLEKAFTRKDTLKFDTDLLQSYSKISPKIIQKMRKHL